MAMGKTVFRWGWLLILGLLTSSGKIRAEEMVYGVLGDPKWLNDRIGCPECPNTDRPARLHQAGIRSVEIRIPWRDYETSPGIYSPSMVGFLKSRIGMLRRNGMKAILNIEWHRYPEWIWEIPDSSYVAEDGTRSVDLGRGSRGRRPNIVFNQKIRDHLTGMIRDVMRELGPENFHSVRVSNGGIQGELAFPDAGPRGWWAYDPNAGGQGTDRPPTIPVRPLGDWRPGRPATKAEVETWYRWYTAALADSVVFQIRDYRQAGFMGPCQIVMPGKGARPALVQRQMERWSQGNPRFEPLLSMGVAWHLIAASIQDRNQVSLHCSSVAEENPVDLSMPGDARDPLDPKNAAFIDGLGASRWIALIADHYGFLKSGENPGKGDSNRDYYENGLAPNAYAQASAAGFISFDWAHHEAVWGDGGLLEDKIAPAIRAESERRKKR